MFKDTGPIDAASILLNLTDYRVIAATHDLHGRRVLIEPVATEAACPSCGVLTTRIQARPVHRVKDLPAGGDGLPRAGLRTAVLRTNHRPAASPRTDHPRLSNGSWRR